MGEAVGGLGILDWIVKAGVPAGIGVVLIWYLLRHIIPSQQKAFQDSMEKAQTTFKEVLTLEHEQCSRAFGGVSDTIRDESKQTRKVLDKVAAKTDDLAKAVHKLYGHSKGYGAGYEDAMTGDHLLDPDEDT
jgi:hypothetical protein